MPVLTQMILSHLSLKISKVKVFYSYSFPQMLLQYTLDYPYCGYPDL